jgi:PhzF family phenazine biosynthesis protein
MTLSRRLQLVDVFTSSPYHGNPVAVVLDGVGLTTAEMQRIARWMNLSETTFLLPPTDPSADYLVRIFAPMSEMPFAGHPTLGSCHPWLTDRGSINPNGVVIQECEAGLIPVRRISDGLAFAAPPLRRSGPVDESLLARIAAMLGIERAEIEDAQWVDNGPGWVAVMLASAEAVLSLRPGFVEVDLGVVGPYPSAAPAAFEVRAFFPKDGSTVEDPVTGSLNASLAQWLLASGRASAPYLVSQGSALGRSGRVHISVDDEGVIWVGGGVVSCLSGQLDV